MKGRGLDQIKSLHSLLRTIDCEGCVRKNLLERSTSPNTFTMHGLLVGTLVNSCWKPWKKPTGIRTWFLCMGVLL